MSSSMSSGGCRGVRPRGGSLSRRGDLVRQRSDGSRRMNVTMDDELWLTETFESARGHLRAVAYRMLGSVTEADDAVQEAWLRLRRADTTEVTNLRGWLTTVV